MSTLLQIVIHTPLWVWPILLLVLLLGLRGLRPATMPPARLAILPLVGFGVSLAGIVQSQQPAIASAGWSVALLVALPLGYGIGSRRAVRLVGDGRIEIAGGWFALVFSLSIFVVRYAQGVLFGMLPALRAEPLWIALSGGVGGIITGIGLGWLANLLMRAYRPAVVEG